MTSASRAAASRSDTTDTLTPFRRGSVLRLLASVSARLRDRFQIRTLVMLGRTVRCARIRKGARAPAPTISSSVESVRARNLHRKREETIYGHRTIIPALRIQERLSSTGTSFGNSRTGDLQILKKRDIRTGLDDVEGLADEKEPKRFRGGKICQLMP